MSHPDTLGRYEVEGVLARGGMGTVYVGRDPVIGRRMAIKVLRPRPDVEPEEIQEALSRFEQEFRVAGTLSHPGIVTIYDVGRDEERSFMAMELVEGRSLAAAIKRGDRFASEEVVKLLTGLCEALDYAHGRGVVHRDLKPANVLLGDDGTAKLTDFGIAKLVSSDMTQSGVIIGTPHYMSPEQVRSDPLTGASDQFSLGVIAFQLLTGRRPFEAERPTSVLYKIVHEPPPDPRSLNPRLPAPVERALLRALAKAPADRYPSCTAFATDLASGLASRSLPGLPMSDADSMPTIETGLRPPRWPRARVVALVGWTLLLFTVSGLSLLVHEMRSEELVLPDPGHRSAPVAREMSIQSDPAGLEIWIDGRSEDRRTPALLELIGPPGRSAVIELRREGEVVARTEVPLGEEDPARWSPVIQRPQSPRTNRKPPVPDPAPLASDAPTRSSPSPLLAHPVRLESDPSGARIIVDGVPTELVTPATLELEPGRFVRFELNGHLAQHVEIDAHETVRVDLPLKSPVGRIDFDSEVVAAPADAEIPKVIRPGRLLVPDNLHQVTGFVVVEVTVDPQGRVARTDILRSLQPELDRAAERMLWERRYARTRSEGRPVNVRFATTVELPPPGPG